MMKKYSFFKIKKMFTYKPFIRHMFSARIKNLLRQQYMRSADVQAVLKELPTIA